MALTIIGDKEIGINGYKYNLSHPLMEMNQSPMPSKLDTGDTSYAQENYLSNWIQKDRRGGILIAEMDESIHADRLLWTDCNIDNDGHTVLPRLATAVTIPVSTTGLTITDPGVEIWTDSSTLTNWTKSTGSLLRGDSSPIAGLYDAILYDVAIVYQDIAASNYAGRRFTFTAKCKTATASNAKIGIWDGKTWTESNFHTGGGGIETLTVTKVFAYNADAFTIRFRQFVTTNQAYFDTATLAGGTTGTFSNFANFNGEKYAAFGNLLAKLDSGRASYTVLYDFGAAITAIIPSLNSRLYVFLGNSTNYYYMSTAEAFTQSNSANAYWGIENAGLLYKLSATGVWASSADPDGAAPTWNNLADITTDVSKIEGLFRGRDASGNYIVYCATNTTQLVYDATNNKWLLTELRLPDHPNGGKGATYWNDGHYFSYGLGIKRYVTGTMATITEVGLDRDDGLMAEYNGEIVKFCADSQYFLGALVDASQTSGSTQSGLYVWDGRSWKCWWADSNNNAAMHDVIVSSAESGYAIYWDCGSAVYYIDIPRGIQNPRQLTGVLKYALSGILISSWFDADTVVFAKLAKEVASYARNLTTTETVSIKYRLNHLYEDRDTGWTTLVVLNSTAENGVVETLLASGAGLSYDAIQYRLDLTRGATNTNSPDLLALVTSYLLRKGDANLKTWNFTVLIDGEASDEGIKEQYDNIWSAITSSTLVPLVFRDDEDPHYVLLYLNGSETQTGEEYKGQMSLTAVEV